MLYYLAALAAGLITSACLTHYLAASYLERVLACFSEAVKALGIN